MASHRGASGKEPSKIKRSTGPALGATTAFTPSRIDASWRDEFLPKRPKGLGQGAAMAVGAHALLLVGLALGLRWQTSEPTVLSAELWAATAQQAAPAPIAPPPPPPAPTPVTPPPPPPPAPSVEKAAPSQADIAIQREREREQQRKLDEAKKEKEKREKEREKERTELAAKKEKERQLAEAEKKKREEADAKRRAAEDEAKLAKQRDEQLRRMQAMVGATGAATATGTAARDAAPSAEYGGRIKARIKPNIVFTAEVVGNPTAVVELRVAPTGRIIGRQLTKSSGNKAWDEAVLRAVDRTEVLPRDVDGRVPPAIVIEFRPNE